MNVKFRYSAFKGRLPLLLVLTLLSLRASCFAVLYLDNLNPGNVVENSALTVAGPARVAIGFDIVTAQDGTWTFTIRAFNPDAVPVGLQLRNNTANGFFTDVPNDASSPFSLSSVSSTHTGGNRYTVVFSGSGALAAGRYWLVGSATVGDQWDWLGGNSSYDVNGALPNDANFFGVRQAPGGTEWNSSAANTLSLRIDVTPVPELAHTGIAAALFLVGCSAAPLVRRSRFMAEWRARRNLGS